MSRTRWVVALGVVVLFAVALGLSGVTADETADTPEALLQVDLDEDSIEMEATVGADGDADWRVIYRFDLDSDEEVQAFEALQADVEENQSAYLGPFEDRIERTAENAAAATEREMTVQGFGVSTDRTAQPDTEFGAVVFAFEWAGFAAVDDGTVEAGDALDSLFLDEGSSLTLRWEETLGLDEVSPQAETATDQRLTWRGPRDFDPGEPRALLVSEDSSGIDAMLLMPILLVALVVALGGVAAYVMRREPQTTAPEGDTTAEETDSQEPPSELLSNEERVLALVEDNGGRIKQQEVAEHLDWSAAMTSQVVGDLREEGEIETFRIGRENVLTLPDVDIVPDQDGEEDEGE